LGLRKTIECQRTNTECDDGLGTHIVHLVSKLRGFSISSVLAQNP
jgi:hypothetical protein